MDKKIIQVGAGPVGLYTAIQIKLREPNADITIYEKYKQYKRSHVLLLNKSSFDKCHPKFKPAVKDIFKKSDSDSIKIKTNEIENKFLKLAKKLGVKIKYEEVKKCSDLLDKYKDADVLIGSDGSHSIVRNQIFKDKMSFKENMKFMAQVKYEANGKTSSLGWVSGTGALLSCRHLVTEQVGKEKNGKTPVSIFGFVSKISYDALKHATAKNPISLEALKKIDLQLYKSFRNWLDIREDINKADKITDKQKVISTTKLPAYCSSNFAKKLKLENKKVVNVALVGDSSFGLPYFVNFNLGIECGSQLAKAIITKSNDEIDELKSIKKDKIDTSLIFSKDIFNSSSKLSSLDDFSIENDANFKKKPFLAYEKYVKDLIGIENFKAQMKNAKISLGEISLSIPQAKVAFISDTSKSMDDDYTKNTASSCLIL